jgi:hypothetical protein
MYRRWPCRELGNLLVRYQLTNITRLDSRHGRGFAQLSFTLLALARKNMAFETFVAFDLAASSDAKSLGRGSIGFDLWHCLLLSGFYSRSTLTWA